MSITEDDLKLLVSRAERMPRGNVSAALHEMVETLRREQALDRLLETLGGHRITEAQLASMRDEIAATPVPRARRRRAA